MKFMKRLYKKLVNCECFLYSILLCLLCVLIFMTITLIRMWVIEKELEDRNKPHAPIAQVLPRVGQSVSHYNKLEIVDRTIQKPDVNVEQEELPPPPVPPRYGFTEEEIYLMTVLLSGSKEVSGDGEFDIDYGRRDEYDQISLVLCVVMNRVRSDLYPDTVEEVIWAPKQFSPMRRWTKRLPVVSDISLEIVTEWCNAYDAHDDKVQTIPEDHLYFRGDGKYNHSR